jgi:predicted RNA-binding protein
MFLIVFKINYFSILGQAWCKNLKSKLWRGKFKVAQAKSWQEPILKENNAGQVVHVYNPCYSRSRDRRIILSLALGVRMSLH